MTSRPVTASGAPLSSQMQLGVVFPQTELAGCSTPDLRRFATSVEALGYRHILAYDHVLGADPVRHPRWTHKYTVHTTFREPLVFFGYLAATTKLELVTGVLVLPQRQTALVAKQAAEVDLLSEGRFRLGVGIGWNRIEYAALGKEFTDRGRRIEEQVAVLRELWTAESIDYSGDYERIPGAGLSPTPRQRPIPIWLGGQSPPAFRRIGRIADGWFPHGLDPDTTLLGARESVREGAEAAGRDFARIAMEPRVSWRGSTNQIIDEAGRWRRAGATHISIDTMEAGLTGVDQHLEVLAEVAVQLA